MAYETSWPPTITPILRKVAHGSAATQWNFWSNAGFMPFPLTVVVVISVATVVGNGSVWLTAQKPAKRSRAGGQEVHCSSAMSDAITARTSYRMQCNAESGGTLGDDTLLGDLRTSAVARRAAKHRRTTQPLGDWGLAR
eukprot:1623843-Prymnesium_polylepis.1